MCNKSISLLNFTVRINRYALIVFDTPKKKNELNLVLQSINKVDQLSANMYDANL